MDKNILFSNLIESKYNNMLNFVERNGKRLNLELDVFHHRFEGFFRFVLIAHEEKKYPLFIKIISIVVDFFLETVGVKLFKFSLFIIVMFDLPIEIKSSSFFIEGCLLLLILLEK